MPVVVRWLAQPVDSVQLDCFFENRVSEDLLATWNTWQLFLHGIGPAIVLSDLSVDRCWIPENSQPRGHSGCELRVELNAVAELQDESLTVSILKQMGAARFTSIDGGVQVIRASVSQIDCINQREDEGMGRDRTHHGL